MSSARTTAARTLANLLQVAREPVFALDVDLRIVFVNDAWEAITGRSSAEVLGLRCDPDAAGPGADARLLALAVAFAPSPEILDGREAGSHVAFAGPDGAPIRRWVDFRPWHDREGKAIGVLGIVAGVDDPRAGPDAKARRLREEVDGLRERLRRLGSIVGALGGASMDDDSRAESRRWIEELDGLRERQRSRHGSDVLVGRGPKHRRLLGQVAMASAMSSPVLIVGESGVGKRAIARVVQSRGALAAGALLPFDCSVLPGEVLLRELFEPDDDPAATPRLAAAPGSTILLIDALGLPRDVQGTLVAAVDDPDRRVGLIGTTAVDPDQARRDGLLRDDFYFAITGLVIRVDPLRDRRDEIPLLAQNALGRVNARGGRGRLGFTPSAFDALRAHDWPGNLRELTRVVEDAHGRAPGELIRPDDLPAAIRGHLGSAYLPPPMPPAIAPIDATLDAVERRIIEGAMARCRRNKSRAAEMLGISRPRLYRRIRELGLPDEPEPADEA